MENSLTAERLRQIINYAPETGLFYWRVSTNNRVKAGDRIGSVNSAGYLRVSIDGRSFLLHRLAWLYAYGVWPRDQIDHINRIRADNRIKNLRESTQAQNVGNSCMNSRNTSGIRGVSWSKSNKAWIATIGYSSKATYLGRFPTKELAGGAYAAAAREKWAEFARPSDG